MCVKFRFSFLILEILISAILIGCVLYFRQTSFFRLIKILDFKFLAAAWVLRKKYIENAVEEIRNLIV